MNFARKIGTTCAALAALIAGGADAQGYPQRPVRLIVPFAAGGTTDAVGRFLAQYLGERLGQIVVVDNRPGGGGTVGANAAARSPADGYTLLMGSAESFGMTPSEAKRLPYNPERDLVPIVMVVRAPNVFAVHPSLPVRSIKELVAVAKAHPGKLHYGTPGVGTNVHLIGELFKHRYQIDLVHVPYKGGGAAVTDAVSGQIEVLLSGTVTIAPRAQAGQLRALAITGSTRAPIMPGVPTMKEAGVNDFVLGPLFGLFAPAGTPPEAIERVARDAIAASRTPELRKRYADVGMEEVEPLTGDAFGRHMRSEVQRWREMAAVAGIKEE